jgi:diaminohydroxyphosphoribosylaminopyrimidine deaminase / 5-amino-6-(5-phosphoribosylamino)uracil reductase
MTAVPMLPDIERAAAGDVSDADVRMMAAALCLARRGLGRVAPNPAVGALIVKDGVIVGRGWTADGGRPHAETLALKAAGAAAKGATLYVTLEPCSHHGRTPPCADAIVAAGVARVVSALDDPDPRVRGQGHARLRAAGIDVRTGVLAEAAARHNLGHCLRVTQRRPMLSLKLAETADGYAANAPEAPRLRITGDIANAYVHMQRSLYDAILVGSGTALADDPLLSVRLPGLETAKPLRIALDSKLRMSLRSRLVLTARDYPTLIVTTEAASEQAAAQLIAAGIDILRFAADADGRVDLHAALSALAARGLTRIFCEGGPRLAANLMQRGFVDDLVLLTGETSLKGQGIAALDWASRASLDDTARFRCVDDRLLGPDRLRRYERPL